MAFENLQQIRDFVEGIPEEKFCTNMFENDQGQRCVAGHLNMKLHNNVYWKYDNFSESHRDTDLGKMLTGFGADLYDLVNANNRGLDGPKQGSLKYFDSLLSKN